VLADRGVLAELARLASDGLAIGLTVTGPRQSETIRAALDLSIDGVNPFRCVQATWNLLEPSAGPALAEAHERGWGVIVKEVFANGRLRERAEIAMAAALSQPWADVVLSGATTREQLTSMLDIRGATLPPEVLSLLRAEAEPADRYWEQRGRLPWT
jgi:aryl-alcohol dehydrogenase-like predicted oxidoreductase